MAWQRSELGIGDADAQMPDELVWIPVPPFTVTAYST